MHLSSLFSVLTANELEQLFVSSQSLASFLAWIKALLTHSAGH